MDESINGNELVAKVLEVKVDDNRLTTKDTAFCFLKTGQPTVEVIHRFKFTQNNVPD